MSHEFFTTTMNKIQHDFWAKVFDDQRYKTIDQNSLVVMIGTVKDLKADILRMWQKFKKIYKVNVQKTIQQEKPKEDPSEEVQCITACTSTAIQQNTENNVMSKENISLLFLEKSMKKGLLEFKIINLIKQTMAKNIPSKVDIQKMIRSIKFNQFLEVMIQVEIRRIFCQLNDHGESYFSKNRTNTCQIDYRVRLAMIEEYFCHRILLVNALVDFEVEVLRLKLERVQKTRNLLTVGISNSPSKIDIEMDKLMKDNTYLFYIQNRHREEIFRICRQLQFYCDTYNIPDEDEIITHRDFVMQKIGKIKEYIKLNEEVMDFSVQIEENRTNVETNDGETPDMSSKVKSVKSRLMENNNNLRNIAMKHQDRIIRVCTKLESYCHAYKVENPPIIEVNCHGCETNTSRLIKANKVLQKRKKIAQDKVMTFQKELIKIHDQLEMYRGEYDMPNENVTIFLQKKPYNPTKTHDDENELLKENEYLAFIAMMHLKKIKEVCTFLKMQLNRFNESTEEVPKNDYFLNQLAYVPKEISILQKDVLLLNEILKDIENIYK